MIKITVDQSVEDALQRAFPRPQGAAYRALANYINTVESMINEAVLRDLNLTRASNQTGGSKVTAKQAAKAGWQWQGIL